MGDGFGQLIQLIRTLRGPKGCPWDKQQDIQSAKKYVMEETYELLDAVASCDHQAILEEAGDLLFQVLFLIELEEEAGHFTLEDVISKTKEKMIRRHPHVFGDTKVNGIFDVLHNWQKIKQDEKSNKVNNEPLIPISMPGSQRIIEAIKLAQKKGIEQQSLLQIEEFVEPREKLSVLGFESWDIEQLKSLIFYLILYSCFQGFDLDKNLKELSDIILRKINQQNLPIVKSHGSSNK